MISDEFQDNAALNSLYERLRRATVAEMFAEKREHAAIYSKLADQLAEALAGFAGKTAIYWRMKVVDEVNRKGKKEGA